MTDLTEKSPQSVRRRPAVAIAANVTLEEPLQVRGTGTTGTTGTTGSTGSTDKRNRYSPRRVGRLIHF